MNSSSDKFVSGLPDLAPLSPRQRVEALMRRYGGNIKNGDALFGGFLLAFAAAGLALENSKRLDALSQGEQA